jgi:cleavage and polyadenylation specificity factor subunit 5
VLLVHVRGLPHLLLLHNATLDTFRLVGGSISPAETMQDGLQRKIAKWLSVDGTALGITPVHRLATWYSLDYFGPQYPYLPAHATQPRQIESLYLCTVPSTVTFSVPANWALVAVPISDLLRADARYGPVIARLPPLLSRFSFRAHRAPTAPTADEEMRTDEAATTPSDGA